MHINSVWSSIIDTPPSCIAFCPARPHILVVGTYLLHKSTSEDDDGQEETATASTSITQKRTGDIIVYKADNASLYAIRATTLGHHTEYLWDRHQHQSIHLEAAILDIEWSIYVSSTGTLAVATSTGSIELYSLDGDDYLQHVCSTQLAGEDVLVLDLIWHPTLSDIIAASLSTGDIVLCRMVRNESVTSVSMEPIVITTHDLEPWTLTITPDGKRLYSGGDDMALQGCDITDIEMSTVLWQDRRTHTAGVTALLPLRDDILVTGSYDDNIRLVYVPYIGRRRLLAELNLGGGVWRLKLLCSTTTTYGRFVILASCMHAGARIISLTHRAGTDDDDDDDWQFEVLAKFEEHESMNYGSDVQPGNQGRCTIVSTSFYDRRVCMWHYDLEAALR